MERTIVCMKCELPIADDSAHFISITGDKFIGYHQEHWVTEKVKFNNKTKKTKFKNKKFVVF